MLDLQPTASEASPDSPSPGLRSTWSRRRTASLLVAAALLSPLMLGTPEAAAAPTQSIREVQAKVEKLQHEAEQASERYNDTREALKSQREKLDAAHVRLLAQRKQLATVKVMLGRLAAETYREGELSTLNMLLDESPDSYLARAGLVQNFSQRREDAARHLTFAQTRLKADEAAVAKEEKALSKSYEQLKAEQFSVERKLAEAEALLANLKASQRRALERASRGGGRGGVPVGTTCRSVDITAPNARAKAAIDFACDQLGKPYVWAADGPGGYDCSGLTMASWRRGGVSLPHSSRLQANRGTRVSRADLQPGDLVFFYSPISHVGLYIGNGMMIHAPHTGDVVRIAPLSSPLTAATRL